MEPCLFRHGKTPDPPGVAAMTPASMEPCLFRHGKGTYAVFDGENLDGASMEPCLFRHGKARSPQSSPASPAGFNGAMSFQTW